MISRPVWSDLIRQAWKKRPVVWLSGVRRVGKTTLSRMIEGHLYMNCDLPSVQRRLEDPESFFSQVPPGTHIIFDEIHRLIDPSSVLKIGSDEYPGIQILATGSSTLEATSKFKDSLTGRKAMVHLTPVLWDECRDAFGIYDPGHRMWRGGLPETLLTDDYDSAFYSEWLDSFYARDIQELFSVRNRQAFMQLMRFILLNSGGMLELTQLSKHCMIARQTVISYIESLRIANFLYLVPPFFGGGKREITHRPKCYGFDTGFVCFVKGWNEIREDDQGILWEHLVLDALRTYSKYGTVFYWRDISGKEIDFVVKNSINEIDIYECKIKPEHFSAGHFKIFRNIYPEGRNYCVCPNIREPYSLDFSGTKVLFTGSPKADSD